MVHLPSISDTKSVVSIQGYLCSGHLVSDGLVGHITVCGWPASPHTSSYHQQSLPPSSYHQLFFPPSCYHQLSLPPSLLLVTVTSSLLLSSVVSSLMIFLQCFMVQVSRLFFLCLSMSGRKAKRKSLKAAIFQ